MSRLVRPGLLVALTTAAVLVAPAAALALGNSYH